ncbi:hypothetical protein Pmani_015303 [Petrolisthes manimaculis]|uniref:RING-type domain-containing protein n=1 Tax=Petrolisthes manimaculis TaxID=1843537 RepID=A0AAE1PU00_9EUCA|nr:hypothetical protein Pmani_015303 [Petrolisthes manimaculis]
MAVLEVCTRFPLLSPELSNPGSPAAVFHGFIDVGGIDHEVYISTPHFPSAVGLTLSTDCHLTSLITACHSHLHQGKKYETALEFLLKLQQICSSHSNSVNCKGEGEGLAVLNKPLLDSLLMHLDTIGWSRVSQVSADFTVFSLTTRDEGGRTHTVKVKVGTGYPQEQPEVEADLPNNIAFSYNPSEGVVGVVDAWEKQLCALQDVWQVLDELDSSALVLDPPAPPPRRALTRRILLENQVSVQLSVSLQHPRCFPQCHLLGPSRLTSPLAAMLSQNFQDWDLERSIKVNLETILGVGVVCKKGVKSREESQGIECAICYCLHFEDALPDLTCDSCSHTYHLQCLYEWLCGQTNSRHSVNVIFGECPFCRELIMCKLPA